MHCSNWEVRLAIGIATTCWAFGCPDRPSSAAAPTRDWKTSPAVVELSTTEDILALGDVHGDYERLVRLLAAAGVIAPAPARPADVQWTAGKAVLVCTGDLIDKGNQNLDVIAAFQAMQAGATQAGGRVIVTMGNHEAMFLAYGARDRHADTFLDELHSRKIEPEQVVAGRDALGVGRLLNAMPIAVQVNDWFFAHAGNPGPRTMAELRDGLQREIDAKGYTADLVLDPHSVLEARLTPTPWWEHEGESPDASQVRLRKVLSQLGARHMVIGHTPGKVKFAGGADRKHGEPYVVFDGLLFLNDVGMSRAINDSEGVLLRIRPGGDVTAIYPDGSRRSLWTGR